MALAEGCALQVLLVVCGMGVRYKQNSIRNLQKMSVLHISICCRKGGDHHICTDVYYVLIGVHSETVSFEVFLVPNTPKWQWFCHILSEK